MNKCLVTTFIVCLSFMLEDVASIAHAEDYKVDAPRVGEGGISPEANFTYSAAHDKSKNAYLGQIYGVNYGVNRFWETSLFVEVEKQPSETTKVSNVKWENIIAPFKPGEHWVDVGLFVGIDKAVENDLTNNLEAKLLLEKNIGSFMNQANIGLDRNFGPHSVRGENAALSWMTTYRIDEKFQPGFEYYSNISKIGKASEFNKQAHVIGPVMQGEICEIAYDTGVLFGLTDGAPDVTLKLGLEYDF